MDVFNRLGSSSVKILVILWHLTLLPGSSSQPHLKTTPPLRQGFPFLAIWNAPSELCTNRFGITFNLTSFPMTSTTQRSPLQQDIRIFYNQMLGHYPHYNERTGQEFNGGIPQQANMAEHLKKSEQDIRMLIPSTTSKGLAVIDWENWRPLWSRNWKQMSIYQRQSIELVQQRDLSLTRENATKIAKAEFEEAAKTFLIKTLQLGKKLRPNQLWGYYLFPNCYNSWHKDRNRTYTGKCARRAVTRNNKLLWLWHKSTALFPSTYLPKVFQSSYKAKLFVRHQVQEAMRVAALSKERALPVYVYTRTVYRNTLNESLSEADLVSTIGESAALGAAGIVVWESTNTTIKKHTCNVLQSYVEDILNHYVLNVTHAARLCSKELCGGNGRCLRKHWDSDSYLHLNPSNFKIHRKANGSLVARGQASVEDLRYLSEKFTCRCYVGRACNF
ncbi:hyaluronidase PH-20-like [Hypanus sabinus]|uniref:hyaluronidase PH-20-like n=1 Tax=Hypanus sabinus TaxID=79690 RepID=UPI0028C4E564|nr:hyaluronidase PH-20-like [Hypanus sabinus]